MFTLAAGSALLCWAASGAFVAQMPNLGNDMKSNGVQGTSSSSLGASFYFAIGAGALAAFNGGVLLFFTAE